MTRYVSDEIHTQGLQYAKNNVDKIVLCVGAPTTFSDADTVNGNGTGKKVLEAAAVSTDFVIANGATDGQKITLTAKNGITPNGTGDGDHICWLNTGNSTIEVILPLASAETVADGGTAVNVPAHGFTMRDPTAPA